MSVIERLGTRLPDGSLVDGYGVVSSDKTEIFRDDRMAAWKAIALRNDPDEGIHNDRFRSDNSPDSRGRFHQSFLKSGNVRIPEDLQGKLRTQGNAL